MTATEPSDLGRALFDEIGDALFLIAPESDRVVDVNPAALRLTGFAREELIDTPSEHLFRYDTPGGMQRLHGALNKTVPFAAQDGYLLRAKTDGGWVPVNMTVSRLHAHPVPLALIIARDDRERRAAFAQVRRVEGELRKVLANSPAALWSAERDAGPDVVAGWHYRFVSPLLARIAGRPAAYFDHPFKWADAVHPQDREAYRAGLRDLLAGPATESERVYRVQTPSGAVRWVREKVQLVRDPAGRPARLDGIATDETDARRSADELAHHHAVREGLFASITDFLCYKGRDLTFLGGNPAFEALAGMPIAGLIGRTCADVFHADWAARLRAVEPTVIATGETIRARDWVTYPDGRAALFDIVLSPLRGPDGAVLGLIIAGRDVTEQTRLEEELRQAAKLEAVGRLAGGIAHDFNNLLTVVLGNLELLRLGVPPATADDLLAATEKAARHAAELTRQMLGFARRQPLTTRPVDVNALAREVLSLLRRTIDARIEFAFRPADDLPRVTADPGQLRQVLMNLCLNARDAMPGGGTLTVETAAAGEGGELIRVSVADTGCGMTDEVKDRIFEPFFTTKDVGQGTGLGLAVVYGAAKAHGGWVDCASAPGAGSRFDVYLPRSDVPLGGIASQSGVVPVPRDGTAIGRGETVLLADDEPGIRAVARIALERLGYRVVLAADGVEAVEAFRRDPDAVGLVVLDVGMPTMSGREALVAIRETAPAARVLFASGHPPADLDPSVAFLPKPYTPSQLADAVRRALDGRLTGGEPRA